MMTLDPHWYSTIFGIVYFAGCFVSFLALSILLFKGIGRAGLSEGLHQYRALPRSGQAAVRLHRVLDLHVVQPVLPDLVRQHARKRPPGSPCASQGRLGHGVLHPVRSATSWCRSRSSWAATSSATSSPSAVGAAYMLVLHWIDLHFYIAPAAAHHGPWPRRQRWRRRSRRSRCGSTLTATPAGQITCTIADATTFDRDAVHASPA